jgi:hypothetical protein
MNYSKQTSFTERLSAQAEAKRALIAKMKPKPMVTAAEPIDREAEREAERAMVREMRQAEKEKSREERELREEAARLAAVAAEQAALEAKRAERKERKSNEKLDAQSRRAERLAAYQGRAFTQGF